MEQQLTALFFPLVLFFVLCVLAPFVLSSAADKARH